MDFFARMCVLKTPILNNLAKYNLGSDKWFLLDPFDNFLYLNNNKKVLRFLENLPTMDRLKYPFLGHVMKRSLSRGIRT